MEFTQLLVSHDAEGKRASGGVCGCPRQKIAVVCEEAQLPRKLMKRGTGVLFCLHTVSNIL